MKDLIMAKLIRVSVESYSKGETYFNYWMTARIYHSQRTCKERRRSVERTPRETNGDK